MTLKKKLDKPLGYMFVLKATASDSGKEPKMTEIDVTLEVKESDNKPPSFVSGNYSTVAMHSIFLLIMKIRKRI